MIVKNKRHTCFRIVGKVPLKEGRNKMIPVSDCFWRCQDCGEEFYTCSGDLQIKLKCPNCGSDKIKGGPIKQGGPMDEDSGKDY